MKITRREVLLSISIILIMLLIGLIIHQSIDNALMLKYQDYNTALQIVNDQSEFEYGMRTNIGNAFVYGELKALNPVTYPEIGGEYAQLKKVKERYTRHTQTYTVMVNGKPQVRTRTYWSWDYVSSESKHTDQIAFLNVPFDYGVIELPSMSHIDTIKESSRIRYVYYGTPVSCIGTLYANLADSDIQNTEFYYGFDIDQTISHLESGSELIVFWVVWIILITAIVTGFYYLENKTP